MEREGEAPSIVQFAESTKEYAGKQALESPQFKMAVAQIGRLLGSETNPEAREAAENLIKQGIAMVTSKVGLLPAFASPQNRQNVIEQLKKDKVEGKWIEVMENWDVQEDPYGVDVLTRCKELDLEEILEKTQKEKDPAKQEQIKLQAEAIGKGQDLIISYYTDLTSSSPKQVAA